MLKKIITNKINIVFLLIILILITSNIITIVFYKKPNSQTTIKNIDKDTSYNKDSIYYNEISYNDFKKKYDNKEFIILAVIDNSSNTYLKFKQLINKLSYYRSLKIDLLETSKLSKKNEVSFYEIDPKFSELQTNYLVTIKDKKIISITTFNNNELNSLIEQLEIIE